MTDNPLEEQVGGSHYTALKIQPMTYSTVNRYDPCCHTILKYISRHEAKGGREDLEKALHCIRLRRDILEMDVVEDEDVHPALWGAQSNISPRKYALKNKFDDERLLCLEALHEYAKSTLADDTRFRHWSAMLENRIIRYSKNQYP